jgi:hypothetical protein
MERAEIELAPENGKCRFYFPPQLRGKWTVRKNSAAWKIYRTRFLIKAQQLNHSLLIVDALGREHRGQAGDYLVESSDGSRRIAPRLIFEDVYVAMGPADDLRLRQLDPGVSAPDLKRRATPRPVASA